MCRVWEHGFVGKVWQWHAAVWGEPVPSKVVFMRVEVRRAPLAVHPKE